MARLESPFVVQEAINDNLLREGEYSALIADSALRPTHDGNGVIIVVELQLTHTDGEVRSHHEWLRINHPHPVAQRIARKSFADLLFATGFSELEDTDDLIGKVCSVRVSIQLREGYPPRNRLHFRTQVEEPPVQANAQEPTTL